MVPQFLSELDGLEDLHNVVVIGASNRLDMIDPAVLRPGRLDIKISIGAPDKQAASDIVRRYVGANMTQAADVDGLVRAVIDDVYDPSRHVALLRSDEGDIQVRMCDLISGARLKNITDRAKMMAIKQSLNEYNASNADHNSYVLLNRDLMRLAVRDEFDDIYDTCAHTPASGWALLLDLAGRRVREVHMAVREEDR